MLVPTKAHGLVVLVSPSTEEEEGEESAKLMANICNPGAPMLCARAAWLVCRSSLTYFLPPSAHSAQTPGHPIALEPSLPPLPTTSFGKRSKWLAQGRGGGGMREGKTLALHVILLLATHHHHHHHHGQRSSACSWNVSVRKLQRMPYTHTNTHVHKSKVSPNGGCQLHVASYPRNSQPFLQ